MRQEAARLRQPVRLLRRRGRWSVELTRLVPVDEQLMRPERYHMPATPELLRTLGPTCSPDRVREAEALLRTPDDGSECGFELDDQGWAPISETRPSLQPLTRTETMALIGDLQAQLTLMRGLHDVLLARLLTVEEMQQTRPEGEGKPGPRSIRKVPTRRDMFAVLQRPAANAPRPVAPGPPAFDGPHAAAPSPNPAASAAAPEAAQATRAADVPLPEVRANNAATLAPARPSPSEGAPVATSTLPPATNARLTLPARSDVIQCLRALAADVEVSPHAAPPPSDFTDYYVARLIDSAQETIGVILVNQRASAALGGGLLGLPLTVRDDQARRGIAKDTLEGLNEVCNNVWGLVNRKNPRTPTKLCALERVTSATSSWLAGSPSILVLATPANGVIYVASR